nr:MAG TPA: hypothetical protein [Caudoviricetes sp.]
MQLLLPTGVILNTDNDMVIQQHLHHGAVEYVEKHKTIDDEAIKNETETLQKEIKPKRGRKSTKTEA